MESLLLLGRDHTVFEDVHTASLDAGSVATAISVGSDPTSPSLASKGSRAEPNEDALLAVVEERRVLAAVADAHFGTAASHGLMAALADATSAVPESIDELQALIRSLRVEHATDPSRTTFTVTVVDRANRRGFGLSIGDSSVVTVGTKGAKRRGLPAPVFIDPGGPEGPDLTGARAFRFEVEPGDLVLVFTDGIDQCHYRSPSTSIGPRHLEAVYVDAGSDAVRYADVLARLALAGVDGNPGGQDNLAIVAVSID